MISRLCRWWASRQERRREAALLARLGCIVRCPRCPVILNAEPGLWCNDGGDFVMYVCTCGMVSEWDFGPPVPILMTAPYPVSDFRRRWSPND